MEERVISKVVWRIIPFIVFLYILNYLDRVNVSLATLQMKDDLKFTDTVYGRGAGIFFIGYFIFEVPSNIIMARVGARRWIARIMISWGMVSTAMMFVSGVRSFYSLRVLLGLAEAGFFPGMILYLTYWIPARQRARAGALFMTSIALSGVIGGPLAGLIMQNMDHVGGMRGWRWLFLIEGVPSIVCGFIVLFVLSDGPQHAKWLTAEEREWLIDKLNSEKTQHTHGLSSIAHAFADFRVWLLSFTYFMLIFGFYGVIFWTPTIVKSVVPPGTGERLIGLLSSIPFIAATIGMVLIGRSSDRLNERRWHVIFAAFLGSAGFVGCTLTSSVPLTVLALCIAAVGALGTLAPFWAVPPTFLSGTAAAAGIACINSIGNLAGLVGQSAMGALKDSTGGFTAGLLVNAAALCMGAVLVLFIGRQAPRPETAVSLSSPRESITQ